jgi:hypothetical protein
LIQEVFEARRYIYPAMRYLSTNMWGHIAIGAKHIHIRGIHGMHGIHKVTLLRCSGGTSH